ncbi:MAG: hypothetical protein HOV66_05440 [Streptomycetaceae bacterium]|nr:hypothetical protein [Streptomycetaceae bacterium]
MAHMPSKALDAAADDKGKCRRADNAHASSTGKPADTPTGTTNGHQPKIGS